MDATELDRIAATLKAAIAEARVLAAASLTGPDVREIIRHARQMHEMFVEALIANEPLATAE